MDKARITKLLDEQDLALKEQSKKIAELRATLIQQNAILSGYVELFAAMKKIIDTFCCKSWDGAHLYAGSYPNWPKCIYCNAEEVR